MLESTIEKKCKAWAKSQGWLAYKFVSPSNRGVPDAIFLKDNQTVFVEFKQPGKVPSTLQSRQIEKLRAQSFKVFVIDSLEGFQCAFTR